MNPTVTVYIPNHNYAKYLSKAINSVINQIYKDWELIIVLDGIVDNSKGIAFKYRNQFPDKIKVIENEKSKGLQYCANKALRASKGEYFIRLDPDDYFNESALMIMAYILDNDEKLGLVYPDYFYVDENENILELDNRKKIGKNVDLLDLPAHGACTMLRTSYLKNVGGYSEEFTAQDGHEIWYKMKDRYKITNVSTPLFYYRQHSLALTRDNRRILNERKKIKRKIVGEKHKDYKIAIIIGAKNTYTKLPNLVLNEFKSRPLVDYTIDAINELDYNGKAFISTDDQTVNEYCQYVNNLHTIKRPSSLSKNSTIIENIVHHTVAYMEEKKILYPDIVVFLNVNNPLKNSSHIQKAIDTLIMNHCDSVISVYEDFDLHFQHKRNGLEAISNRRHKNLRVEREALYVDNRAINVCWRNTIRENDFRGKSISHIVMEREESINIKSHFDFDYAEIIIDKLKEKV